MLILHWVMVLTLNILLTQKKDLEIIDHLIQMKLKIIIYLNLVKFDIQINYYYKTIVKKENISKLDFFNQTIDEYLTFLQLFNDRNIIVCGINLPSPSNYKRYLIKCFNVKKINTEIDKLTLDDINNDTITFNELLKQKCDNLFIKYFDLTDECTIKVGENIMLKPEFIGHDHHYKGSIGFSGILNRISEHNKKTGESITDYLHYPEFSKTYYEFLNKLINSLR